MSKKKNYQELKTTPFETGIRNFTSVAKFFMYYAPGIDSAQSPGDFDNSTSQNLLNDMIKDAKMENRARFLKKIQPTSWKSVDFENDKVDFEQPRFLCDKYGHETEFHALLRHMRNALAHGHLYVWRKAKNGTNYYTHFCDSSYDGDVRTLLRQWVTERGALVDLTQGCGGFARAISDGVYGATGFPARQVNSISELHPGDISVNFTDATHTYISHVNVITKVWQDANGVWYYNYAAAANATDNVKWATTNQNQLITRCAEFYTRYPA